jgi:hypothetical protein
MFKVFSQDEIDLLISSFNGGIIPLSKKKAFKSIDAFKEYLTIYGKYTLNELYGISDCDIPSDDIDICSFFDNDKSGNLLEDIKRKNAEQGVKRGSIEKIPGFVAIIVVHI